MPMSSPDAITDIALLKQAHADNARDIARIEQAQIAGMKRLEEKLDRIETDLVSRPTEAIAKSMARVWAFAAASFTGLISTVVMIATMT